MFLQLEEVTATELAWISQLLAALDGAWNAHYPDGTLSTILRNLTPQRSPRQRVETVEQAHAYTEAARAAAPEEETYEPLSPRAALRAAEAALAAAQADARWAPSKVSRQPLPFCTWRAANERDWPVCDAQVAAASTGLVVVLGLGALAYQRGGSRSTETQGLGMRAAMAARWAALWPAAAQAPAVLPVAAAPHRGRE